MKVTSAKSISAQKVLRLYAESNGGIVATRDLLAFHLREGHIRVRSGHVMKSDALTYGQAWRESARTYRTYREDNDIKLKNVPVGRWWRSADWLADRDSWKLHRSALCVTISVSPPVRIMMRYVRFNSADIRNCFDPSSRQQAFKQVGRSSEKIQWRMFWHEVVRLIKNDPQHEYGLLNASEYNGADKTADKIRDHLLEKGEYYTDDEVAETIEGRLAFRLSFESVKKEVQSLRTAMGLSR